MFYAHFVLAKKGPMARIWLAAHWDKKLTKAHVFETNIEKSVDGILEPKVKMALRTTGHLLLGIVRIYSRKAKYLLADCNEAFIKIKLAFRPGTVDLPEDSREAAVAAITLPEVFHDFDKFTLDFDDMDLEEQLNNSLMMRHDEITLREVYGRIDMDFENGFGDLPGDAEGELSVLRDTAASEQLREASLQLSHRDDQSKRTTRSTKSRFLQGQSQGGSELRSFNPADLAAEQEANGRGIFDDLSELNGSDAPQNRLNKIMSQSPRLDETRDNDRPLQFDNGAGDDFGGDDFARPDTPSESGLPEPDLEVTFQPQVLRPPGASSARSVISMSNMSEHTTLLHDEAESFALEPVEASAIRGQARPKRKRRLIVDNVKSMSADDMKSQMFDTDDILIPLDLAPPTKKLMVMKEVGATERLFSHPVRVIFARDLQRQFHVQSLLPLEEADEMFGLLGDTDRERLILERTPAYPGQELHRDHRGKKRKLVDDIQGTNIVKRPGQTGDKENMPPPTCFTPARTPGLTPGPSSLQNTPGHLSTPSRLGTPLFAMNASDRLASPKYLPTPGNKGTHSLLPNPGHQFDADDFGGFDDFNMDDGWNPPVLEEPPSSPAHRSITPSTLRRDISNVTSDISGRRLDGETTEAFEERAQQKRLSDVRDWLQSVLVGGNKSVSFSKLIEKNERKEAAQKFYSLLVLKKSQVIDVLQEDDSDEITISRGGQFETTVF